MPVTMVYGQSYFPYCMVGLNGPCSMHLTDREKQYSVLDKEALAIVYEVTKFYQYIYGRKFILCTDHKPLERILSPKREAPKMAANRLQCWAQTLCSFRLQHIVCERKGECTSSQVPICMVRCARGPTYGVRV